MGVGIGMAHAWLRAIREGHKARQTMAHLSKRRWNYLGKRLHQHQRGRGSNQAGGFGGEIFKAFVRSQRRLNQQGSGLGIPLMMLASWGINKIRKKIKKGSGKRRTTTRRPTHFIDTIKRYNSQFHPAAEKHV